MYVGLDPLNLVDPTGRDAEITRKGNNVRIKVPIVFKGGDGDSPSNRQDFVQSSEQAWSGKKGEYDVTTRLVAPSPHDRVAPNTVTFSHLGSDKPSFTRGGRDVTINVDSSTARADGKHETGHLMNNQDRYSEGQSSTTHVQLGRVDVQTQRTTAPVRGWQGNIMAQQGGAVDQLNIDEAMQSPSNVLVNRDE